MKTKVGVVVGRFQVASLHRGHRDLLNYVANRCQQLVVVLGSPRSFSTDRNPLPFAFRAAMVQKAYPEARVVELFDHPSDEIWSRDLDDLINQFCPQDSEVTLYGSRDSFISVYSGVYRTDFFQPLCDSNGTKNRQKVGKIISASRGFLSGLIYREETRLPIAYPTVDIAILRDDKVLLAGKSQYTDKLFFIGGFVDESDSSLEFAARREIQEETGMETGKLSYIGSHKVDDWRYRGTKDGIITSFFCSEYIFGAAIPHDDVSSLEWVPVNEMMNRLSPEHQPLAKMLLESLHRS